MTRGVSDPPPEFLCTICNRTFKKQKYLNNHNKDKHPKEINKSLKLKVNIDTNNSTISFKPEFSDLSINRFIKLKKYLEKVFENNIEIYIPLNLHHTDFRILTPINNENYFDGDFLGIRSADILIIRSIIKCYSKNALSDMDSFWD